MGEAITAVVHSDRVRIDRDNAHGAARARPLRTGPSFGRSKAIRGDDAGGLGVRRVALTTAVDVESLYGVKHELDQPTTPTTRHKDDDWTVD
jgi:hypothetical protein